ncbi:hypothetical protein JXQ70_17315 [bacterium]|nr:hypothetical protein [bacterium]
MFHRPKHSHSTFNCSGIVILLILLFMLNSFMGCAQYRAQRYVRMANEISGTDLTDKEREQAARYLNKALQIYRNVKQLEAMVQTYLAMGDLYGQTDQTRMLEHYQKAIKVWDDAAEPIRAYHTLKQVYQAASMIPLQPNLTRKLLLDLEQRAGDNGSFDEQIEWLLALDEWGASEKQATRLASLIQESQRSDLVRQYYQTKASQMYELGDYLAALTYYQKILNQEPSDLFKADDFSVQLSLLDIFSKLDWATFRQQLEMLVKQIVETQEGSVVLSLVQNVHKYLASASPDEARSLNIQVLIEPLPSLVPAEQLFEFELTFSRLLQCTGHESTAALNKARSCIQKDSVPEEWTMLIETAVAVREYNLANDWLEQCREIYPDLPLALDLKFTLLKTQVLLGLNDPASARDTVKTALLTMKEVASATQADFLCNAVELFLEQNSYQHAQELLDQNKRLLVENKDNLSLHTRLLESLIKLQRVRADHSGAITTTHNLFALFAQQPGYQLKKAQLYEILGEIALQQGYIDQKFNPFDMAAHFVHELPLTALHPDLHLKLLKSRLLEPDPKSQRIRDQYFTLFKDLLSHLIIPVTQFQPLAKEYIDFLVKYDYPCSLLYVLEILASGESVLKEVDRRHLTDLNEILDFKTNELNNYADEQLLDRLVLLVRCNRALIELIRRDVLGADSEQINLGKRLELFKRNRLEYEQIGLQLAGSGQRCGQYLSLIRWVLQENMLNIAEDTLLLGLFNRPEGCYAVTLTKSQCSFEGFIPNEGKVWPLNDVQEQDLLFDKLIMGPLAHQTKIKKLIVIADRDFTQMGLEQWLDQSQQLARIKTKKLMASLDPATIPQQKPHMQPSLDRT